MSQKLNQLLEKLRLQYKEERDPAKKRMIASFGKAVSSYLKESNTLTSENMNEADVKDSLF